MKYIVKNASKIIYLYNYDERTGENIGKSMVAQLEDGDILEGTYDGNEYVRVVRVNGRKLRSAIGVHKADVRSCCASSEDEPLKTEGFIHETYLGSFENRPPKPPTITAVGDVGKAVELQHKVDVYENYIILLSCMIQGDNPDILCLQSDLELDGPMDKIWSYVRNRIREGKG